jgi:hypothetical protein
MMQRSENKFIQPEEMLTMKIGIRSTIFLLACVIPTLSLAQARTVKRISITSFGQAAAPENMAFCKHFKPTLQQAKLFFSRAYYVPAKVRETERDASCYATGKLSYSDNSFGTWTLFSNGTALFIFNRGDEVNLYSEDKLWPDPFSCSSPSDKDKHCPLTR